MSKKARENDRLKAVFTVPIRIKQFYTNPHKSPHIMRDGKKSRWTAPIFLCDLIKIMQKMKGRPRKFNTDQVMETVAVLFAHKGYSATSLDDISLATSLARPSLYNAFGDKLSLYRKALAYHLRETHAILRQELCGSADIGTELTRLFAAKHAFYRARSGCLTLCTAPAEALNHPEIAEDIRVLFAAFGQLLETRFERAASQGELRPHVTPQTGARATQALLQSLALRVRAGEAEEDLQEMIRAGIMLLIK